MQIEFITSENPENHWRFLNPKDKIVMDMGCSFWDSSWHDDWYSSSEWFVNKGASKLIGFDCAEHDIQKYHKLYGNDGVFETFQLCVSEDKHIEDVLKKYKPQVIKCDIEGAEIHFQNVTKEMIEFVDEIAIEYHNGPTKEMCENKIKEWEFNSQLYQLGDNPIESAGVWHLYK
jgi:hypothetical protein